MTMCKTCKKDKPYVNDERVIGDKKYTFICRDCDENLRIEYYFRQNRNKQQEIINIIQQQKLIFNIDKLIESTILASEKVTLEVGDIITYNKRHFNNSDQITKIENGEVLTFSFFPAFPLDINERSTWYVNGVEYKTENIIIPGK